MSSNLLDLPLENRFWSSLQEANTAAGEEAANTGGAIIRIEAIRVENARGVVSGRVASSAIDEAQHYNLPPGYAKPRSIGTLHLTWESLIRSRNDQDIGYLVVQRPFGASSLLDDEESGMCFVSVEIPRQLNSLRSFAIGATVCRLCSRPIDQQRLIALPTTKICKSCQESKEKKDAYDSIQ